MSTDNGLPPGWLEKASKKALAFELELWRSFRRDYPDMSFDEAVEHWLAGGGPDMSHLAHKEK